MKQSACSRLWQAEAIEDGRLGGGDLASFQRHVQTCRVCSMEVERLRELGRLAVELPVLETTPLERRRQRQRLLRSANQLAVEPPPRASRRMLAAAVVLATTTAMAAGGAYVLRSPAPQASHVAPAPASVAQHSVRHVRHASARLAPPAAAPSADEPANAPRAALEAASPSGIARPAAPRSPARVALADPVRRAPARRESSAPAPEREALTSAPGASSPDVAPHPPTAGQDFSVAMQAFNSGNFGRAEQLFATFVQHHPGDSRAEDASFLRVVARRRRGDMQGAKALARDYLDRYPGALRHEEAEAMLDR